MKWAVRTLALALACLLGGNVARAATVTYTIVPELSSLKMTGDVIGAPISAQAVGGDIANYQGTITGDLTAGVLTFSGGSVIDAMANPAGPFLPNSGGIEDNYGVTNGALPVAFRDIVIDITAGTLQHGAAPVGMDLPVAFYLDSLLQAGAATDETPNTTAAFASLVTAGNVETLTIPILRDSGIGGPLHIVIEGQIVASRVVPEPSSLALGGLSLLAAAGCVWRRRR